MHGYIYQKTSFNTCQLELKRDEGRPFSVHKKIAGTPLAEKIEQLSEEEIAQISADIAKFMAELHQVNFQNEKIFTINDIGLNLSEFLDELLTKHVSQEDRAFWKFSDTVETPKCLVHGDLNLSNVLLDENNKVTAIIDFGFAGYGNIYDDVARILSRNYEKYAQTKLDEKKLEDKVIEWINIDQGYINYMRGIGIYG